MCLLTENRTTSWRFVLQIYKMLSSQWKKLHSWNSILRLGSFFFQKNLTMVNMAKNFHFSFNWPVGYVFKKLKTLSKFQNTFLFPYLFLSPFKPMTSSFLRGLSKLNCEWHCFTTFGQNLKRYFFLVLGLMCIICTKACLVLRQKSIFLLKCTMAGISRKRKMVDHIWKFCPKKIHFFSWFHISIVWRNAFKCIIVCIQQI